MKPLPDEEALGFGTMRLFRTSRLLMDAGRPLRLGGRAFDLLAALLERAGEVVTKDELVSRVWPKTIVEETSLRVHIGALRKLLGDGQGGVRLIVNVPGRGYSFVAPVVAYGRQPAATPPTAVQASARLIQLPARLTRMVGRLQDVRAVAVAVRERRLVTIAGAGGIGKTTLALAVAEEVLDGFEDGVVFIDLAILADGGLIANAIGNALGVSVPADAPVVALGLHLRDKRMLLVLDNCEHVIEHAAQLAAQLLRVAAALHILTTSREPLRADAEFVRRLSPLPSPPVLASLTASEALSYPAVQLLIERITSATDHFVLTDADAGMAGELCRRLDGIPLAIELAAVRVGFFGLRELVARLDDRLRILSSGHRTVLPRHQTLRALHDWSYQLLPAAGQRALRNLSVFPGTFTLADALAIVSEACEERLSAEETVIDLVAKSLITIDLGGEVMRYRLLDTTRTYAAEQLSATDEQDAVRRRHAERVVEVLNHANPQWSIETRLGWLERYGVLIDDVRTALDWAHGRGEAILAASLTQLALQLGQQLSLLEEFRLRIEQAVNALALAGASRPLLEMQLNMSLSMVMGQINATPRRSAEVLKPVSRAAEAARQLASDGHHGEVSYARWVVSFGHGDYPAALSAAQDMETGSRAAGDDEGAIIGQRMLAQSWHFLGNHSRARDYVQRVLQASPKPLRIGGKILDPMDRRVSMRIILSRIQWLEGASRQAHQTLKEAMQLAGADMGYAQCQVLGMAACPIAIWEGDTGAAQEHVRQLLALSVRHALGYWRSWGLAFEQVLAGESYLKASEPGEKLHDVLGTMAADVVDAALLARTATGTVGWCSAEHLRAHGENLLAQSVEHAREAEQCFVRALETAREQGALAWELRAAMSLVRLQRRCPVVREDASSELHAACHRFPQDADTGDLRAAWQLLAAGA